MDLVKAEPGHACDICGEPAIVVNLDNDTGDQSFYCAPHAPVARFSPWTPRPGEAP
jgi:hypothetical protein